MSISLEFFKKHQTAGTHLHVFLTSGAMLEGKIIAADEGSIVLNECLINTDKIISVAPPKKQQVRR